MRKFHLNVTEHAETRMSQRGVREEDVKLVLDYGTQIGPSEWFMKDSDVAREMENIKRVFQQLEGDLGSGKQLLERALKRKAQRLERLRGLQVVVEGDDMITCLRPSEAHLRRVRRAGRRHRR